MTINCGIIGFGKMGQIRARAIADSGIGRVVAVYDINPEITDAFPVLESPDAIIHHPDVEAVFIATPNFQIKPLVIQALNAGKHVFSEKPPGINAAEVREIRKAEAAAGDRKLMFGFNHRHHLSIRKMKDVIDSGDLGRVLWMRGRYGKEVDESFFSGWRAKKELSGGGIMLDQGIHMLDLFLYLGGDFDEVHAFVSNLFWHIEGVEDNVFAIFRSNQSGICASLHSTMTQWRYLFSLEIFLEKGALVLNGLKTSSGAYGDEDLAIKKNHDHPEEGRFESEERITYHTDTSWESEINAFFSAIRDDSPINLGNSTDALKLMEILDKIYQNQ